MPIQFTSPVSIAVHEGGNPNLRISAVNTLSSNIPVNIELTGDVDLFRHSGLDHFLGDGAASQYFPNGVDYDRPVKTVYELTAHAVSEWYDDGGYHREEATQTFQLNITDLPIPDHSDFESASNFSIGETSGESRVVYSTLWELSAFGATHTSPASETQNSGPLKFVLVDDDGGNFESFTGGGYSDPYHNPNGFWIRSKAGASIQVGENGTAQRHIKVQITDGTNYDIVDMTINVENVLPTTPVDASGLGDGVRGNVTYQGFIGEDVAAGTAVGITAHSTDAGSTPLTYSILNPDSVPFTIDAQTGVVTVKAGATFDFETQSAISFAVSATDGRPGSASATTFTVDIRDVNEAPVFHSMLDGLILTVEENTTEVIDLQHSVADFDTTGDTVSFSVTGGLDADLFSISSSGQLAFKAGPDFDAPLPPSGPDPFGINQANYLAQTLNWMRHTSYGYDVQVSARDNHGAAASKSLNVHVKNVNEAPLITTDRFQVASGSNVVGRVMAIDPDGDSLYINYVSGDYASQGTFALGPDGTVSFWSPKTYDPNNPTNNLYQLPVAVTDRENGGGFTVTKSITIEVLPPPPPVDSTPPALGSATISGSSLILNYDGPIDHDHLPPASAFSVMIDNVSVGVAQVGLRPDTPNGIVLVLNGAATAGQAVKISYADPTSGNDALAIQDAAGNDAASLVNVTVQGTSSPAVVQAGSVSINDISLTEGDSGTKLATFTISRTGGTAAFDVSYATVDGDAKAGSDYLASSGTLHFAAGETAKSISVGIKGDLSREATESLFLTLSAPTNGATFAYSQGSALIGDDDTAWSQNKPLFGEITEDVYSTGGQVYALYEGLLGRAPDPLGLEYWAASFEAGVPPSVLAAAFLNSDEGKGRAGALDNESFVEQLYGATLHRHSDPLGLQYWTSQLEEGVARGTVGAGFALSDEHLDSLSEAFDGGIFVPDQSAASVARLYYGILDRAPDAGGLSSFASGLAQGASLQSVAAGMLGSSEYRGHATGISDPNFVEHLYLTALNRHSGPVEVQYWTGALDAGMSRADVAIAFMASPEFQGTYAGQSNQAYVDAVYVAALGRHADAGGLSFWTEALNEGTSRTALGTAVARSAEFQDRFVRPSDEAFVDQLYEDALGRDLDAAGMQYWTASLEHGATRADVAIAVSQSAEAQQHHLGEIEMGWHLA